MRRSGLIALVALAGCAALAPGAGAKGAGTMPAPAGVTVAGSPYRYVAIDPRLAGAPTVVERIDRRGGHVGRWWYLRGDYYVPAVAYDGSGGGLSADGSTLVLSRFEFGYPPRETRFAVLDTDLRLRHPYRAGGDRSRYAITRIDLRGFYSFDAISPDGETAYLIHYLRPSRGLAEYEVRALDLAGGRLLPGAIVDPSEPDEPMAGLPISRAASLDGRWAYTLYDGNGKEPFVHALDTVRGRAVCVDLPQLEGRRDLFLLELDIAQGGRGLELRSDSPVQGRPQSPPLLSIDTRTFAVQRPAAVSPASSDGSVPWLPIGIAVAALAAGLVWIVAGRERAAARKALEQ